MSFFSSDLLGFWSEWIRPSAGLPTVWWALLIAAAAAVSSPVATSKAITQEKAP